MHNTERKMDFIVWYTKSADTAVTCERLFNRFEVLEKRLNKDICQMTADEIQGTINEFSGVAHTTSEHSMAILSAYAKWCISNGVDGSTETLLNIEPNQAVAIRKTMYASPQHLESEMNKVFWSVDLLTVHNIYRAYIWMAYMGVPLDKIESIEKMDVDFSSNTLHSGAGVHSIYMEAISTFENCVKQNDFFNIKSNQYGEITFRTERVDSKLLLSRKKNKVKCDEITRLIHAAVKDTGFSFRYDHLYLSGMFYRMYIREQEGFPVDFKMVAESVIVEKRMVEQDKRKMYEKIRETANRYKIDYENWKRAFYE